MGIVFTDGSHFSYSIRIRILADAEEFVGTIGTIGTANRKREPCAVRGGTTLMMSTSVSRTVYCSDAAGTEGAEHFFEQVGQKSF